ncbi:MAG: hypothetical protein WB791_04215 [Waddliaceae bacterium]
MNDVVIGVISYRDVVYFGSALLLVILGLLASFIFSWWMNRRPYCPCPYTHQPLRKASDLHYLTKEKVLRYLFDMHDYYNRMFDFDKAAISRLTGRIFPDALNWSGGIRVNWDFLQKRYSGDFVSWGSLTEQQQLTLMDKHTSLEGFQTEFSSRQPSPRAIEPEYGYKKPGPLYVDIDSGVLLGWKCVPDTDLEVLIVQKPIEVHIPGQQKRS